MGPWTAYHDYKTTWGVKNSDDEPICDRLDEACARLMAAAPDLLEVLSIFVDSYPTQIEPLKQRARHLIAKAKGE